jgi:transposase-like protein
MEQKQRFVSLAESGYFTVTELCREFGISRKTGHKWLSRYRLDGRSGLEEKSRAPNDVPGKIELEIECAIVSERRVHPRWGPKSLSHTRSSWVQLQVVGKLSCTTGIGFG